MDKPKIGFIAGCFDRFHEGHEFIISEAKKYCDRLYVGLNIDKYIIEKKGRKPYSWDKRARELEKRGAWAVLPFYSNPIDIILNHKPDYIFVGDDYTETQVIGAKECVEWGGRVIIIPRIPNISTTNIIKQSNK